MAQGTGAESYGRSQHDATAASITEVLHDVTQNLSDCLKRLEQLGPGLAGSIHHEHYLPDWSNTRHAAQAVDTLHKIQVLLDPPVLVLADHFLGYTRTQCLCAAVQSGIPDSLDNRTMTLDELAKATNSRSDRLGQILRILCNSGIFSLDEASGQYSNTPASLLLRSNHWTQWHNWVQLYGTQFYDIARGIQASIRKGTVRSAAQINYDTDDNMFSFFHSQGWVPELHRTLGGGAAAQMPGVLEDYPWDEVADGLVMDIGGGGGAFITGLLRRFPTMQGGIFDLSHVIDHVRGFFQAEGQYADIGNRVQQQNLIAGDFFKSIPQCKVYTMKWCLHDWRDPQVVEILTKIRESIILGPQSRLIVLESNLSNEHSDRLSVYGDINMMMTANGQERTERQWKDLAESSGWKVMKVWDLRRAWVKAMDFRPL
ncbi:O-methyltransferase-domain-containing protein [Truncatella angustata]|uniref:O-methyltransferase-domain-containing protein n=1 Tax=Truncatella angustata TaxID=152316 RepID=A0A9P8USB8_9PEZI|nr:O-methyltransferase-domain-containing protein [Truncatella angustata]KAH6657448.1 O-methyltransferase-domain-containing protein [Truncatella angustata]